MSTLQKILSPLGINLSCVVLFKLDGEVSCLFYQEITLDSHDLSVLSRVLHKPGHNFTENHLPRDLSIIIAKISKSKKYLCIKEEYKNSFIVKVFSISNNSSFSLDNHKAVLAKISFYINEQLNNIEELYRYNYKIDPHYIAKRKSTIDNDKITQYLDSIEITKYPIKQKNTGHIVILSPQQSKIMLGFSRGLNAREMEEQYAIKVKTIEYYLLLIKAKTGYRKKLELLYAFRETNPWLKEFNNE